MNLRAVPTLWVVAGPNVGARFDFERELTLGRSSTCEVVLRDRRISRRHAQIHAVGTGFEVADLGSRNGVLRNGRRVQGTESLAPGDRLQVGFSHFVFEPPPLLELTDAAPRLLGREPDAGVARLARVLAAWVGAATPAAILRLALGELASVLAADRGGLLRVPAGGGRVDVIARRGPGTPRLPVGVVASLREGRAAGTETLLAAPLGSESLSFFVERGAGGYRGGDLELVATVASLCGRNWDGARANLRGERDRAFGLWELKPATFGPALRKLFDRVLEAAPHQGPVLILGERSTGRQALAHLLHQRGRDGDPFHAPRANQVKVTGWPAWLARAEGGTLYLGDLAELYDPPGLVAALAALEAGQPSDPRLPATVRLVASSRIDVDDLVEEARLPLEIAELFAGGAIQAPPLRDLSADMPTLVDRLLPEVCRHVGRPQPRLSPGTLEAMAAYPWPGNLAELTACLAGLALAAGPGPVEPWLLPVAVRLGRPAAGAATAGSLAEAVEAVERAAIASALREAGGKKLHAARVLRISRPTLDKKIAQYGLRVSG